MVRMTSDDGFEEYYWCEDCELREDIDGEVDEILN
jgi:hypothetical protein